MVVRWFGFVIKGFEFRPNLFYKSLSSESFLSIRTSLLYSIFKLRLLADLCFKSKLFFNLFASNVAFEVGLNENSSIFCSVVRVWLSFGDCTTWSVCVI